MLFNVKSTYKTSSYVCKVRDRTKRDYTRKEDLTWLKHEKAEQWYEQKHDAGYSESHEKAESHWSGTPWTNTEDKK